MAAPCQPVPADEPARLAAVRAYEILGTPPEQEFDALTRLAAFMFDTSIAVVSVMDENRQWFKSKIGLDVPELDRRVAFCAHAIMEPRQALVVEDLRTDGRFSGNPLVTQAPHIRFYAGAPIIDPNGFALGTIAVIDARPRQFSAAHRDALVDLSTLVMTALRNRRSALEPRKSSKRHARARASPFCAWTSTASRRSMTNTATLRATKSCAKWPGVCRPSCEKATRSRVWAATNSAS